MTKVKKVFNTTFTFKMSREAVFVADAFYPAQEIEIKLSDADDMTLDVLLEYINDFIQASGYHTEGPLEYIQMEAKKTMRILQAKE
jgi:hypothetical protein